MKVKYIGDRPHVRKLGTPSGPSASTRGHPIRERTVYWFQRGVWVEVRDEDAAEYREMTRTNPETWETDWGVPLKD